MKHMQTWGSIDGTTKVMKSESVNRTVSSYNKSSLTQFFYFVQFKNRLQESTPAVA